MSQSTIFQSSQDGSNLGFNQFQAVDTATCHLPTTFVNSLDPDHDQQRTKCSGSVGRTLDWGSKDC